MNKKQLLFVCSLLPSAVQLPAQLLQADSTQTNRNYTINEVVVTGTRNETDIRHLPMTISVVNRSRIEQSQHESLLPLLTEQVPGLFTTARSVMGYGVSTGAAGGMSLRGIGGSPTTGLLVLIDGHPQYMGLMGHPIADSYQSMLADRVEVVRGPASMLYGSNAMGGVINIVTRKQREDGIKTNLKTAFGSYNTVIAEGSNMIRKGRFSSVVTASYNRSDGHRADMDFEQYGGYAKLGYDFSYAWNIFADVNITHFNASNPGTVTAPLIDNDSHITRGVASLSLENHYERTSGAFKFYYNWGRHKINDGYSEGESPLDYRFNSRDYMLGISWYQSAELFKGNRLTVGVDYQHFGGEAWNLFLDSRRTDIADKQEDEVAGYIDFRQNIGRYVSLDAGVRLDHHSITGTEWIPQGGVSVHLPYSGELKAMVSKGYRNPTIRELFMFPPANQDLRPERLMNYELSFSQHLLDNALSYNVCLYYINGDNMIQTLRIDGRPLNVNTGKIENWGVEAGFSYRFATAWRVAANYSWLRMKYPVISAPEHKLYVEAGYVQGRWNVSTGMQYVNGLYTSVSPDTKENFLLWNIRGSFRVSKVVSLFVRGENLLAQKYEILAGYPMPRMTFLGGIDINF